MQRDIRRPKATVQLHIADGHGHMERSREEATAVRHLQVHQRPVPVLPEKHSKVSSFIFARRAFMYIISPLITLVYLPITSIAPMMHLNSLY